MSANGALLLTEARARMAAVLAPASDADPEVLADLVDAVQPPALMLEWNDPWVTMESVAGAGTVGGNGGGLWFAQLNVICFAGRIDAGAGIETLEQLLNFTLGRLQADPYSWPLSRSQAPRRFEINNVSLLGARLLFRVPVRIEGG